MPRAFSFFLAVLLLASACGGPGPKVATADSAPSHPRSDVELYFPLEEGKIYHYVTRDADDTGMLIAKVHRTSPSEGELRLSNATKHFAFVSNGVSYVGGAYILKTPLDVGSSWPGEHDGTTKIVATDVSVEVPAGHYASCLRTVEEGGRPKGSRYETTYCPGVGMVLLVVSAGGNEARAELKSYGMPIKID